MWFYIYILFFLFAAILSDMKMCLVARSLSNCPGLISLISNLSGSSYPDILMKKRSRSTWKEETIKHVEDYLRGAVYGLYSFKAPGCMLTLPFEVYFFLEYIVVKYIVI